MAIQQPQTPRIQMMLRWICGVLLAALIFVACEKDDVPEPVVPVSHTMLLYMPGQSLLRFYEKNIQGIEQAVESGALKNGGRIIVCYQPKAYDQATLFEIVYDARQRKCVRKELKIYENFHADETASVQEMFADIQLLAPADSYGLAIGCHGFGWIPKDASLPQGQYVPERPLPGALITRSTRFFGDSGHLMDIAQLADAVAGLSYRFDYLIFDGCFMSNIETLYDLRHSFDYIVSSPCEIMGAGFPYARTIPYLFVSDGPDLAAVCHAFWYFYDSDWDTVSNNARSGCISLTVTNELEALAVTVAEIQAGAKREYNVNDLQYYEGMSSHIFYDLGDYLRAICADDTLYARFEEQLNRTFPAESRLNTPSFYSVYNHRMTPIKHYSGVTTTEPSRQYADLHKKTAWYRRTHAAD